MPRFGKYLSITCRMSRNSRNAALSTFPMPPFPAPKRSTPPESAALPANGTALLLCKLICQVLQLLLDDEGHRTLVAADGRKAFELAAQGAVPSLVIADYNLPNGLNGLEVIASLRKAAPAGHPGHGPDR